MPDYLLYGHRESGHSYKVRLALTLLGAAHEYREIDLFAPREQRPRDWQVASRFGEVPVLVADGRPIVQSDGILLHLARKHRALGWEVDPDRLTEWLFWEANRIGISLPNLRLYTHFKLPAEPGVEAWLQGRLTADLTRLDDELGHSHFLLGDAISAADIACCAYLFFADQVAVDLADWPNVAAWLDRIRALPGWQHPYALMR